MLYQIACGHAPFRATSLEDLTWQLRNKTISFSQRASNLLSRELKDLIQRLLEKNPHRRISWEDFFNHPWFGEPITLPNELTYALTFIFYIFFNFFFFCAQSDQSRISRCS